MPFFDRRKRVSIDQMGMLLVSSAGTTVTDDLLRDVSPFMEGRELPEFATELLIHSLFPFDLVNVTSRHPRGLEVTDAIIKHSLDIANADRTTPSRPPLSEADWKARALERFEEYGRCLASKGAGPADQPMYRYGKAAAMRILDTSLDPRPIMLFATRFSPNLHYARDVFASVRLA